MLLLISCRQNALVYIKHDPSRLLHNTETRCCLLHLSECFYVSAFTHLDTQPEGGPLLLLRGASVGCMKVDDTSVRNSERVARVGAKYMRQ